MKCKSCQGEVPPKFTHAIAVNSCPLCGEEIMEADLQVALTELKSAMSATANYPDEVFDWLKSNYNLIPQTLMDEKLAMMESSFNARVQTEVDKVKANYFKATPKVKSSSGNDEVTAEEITVDKDGNQTSGETIQSPEQTNKFLKAAGVKKMVATKDKGMVDRNAHYKDIVNQIKRNGAPALIDESGGSGVITPDMIQALDPDETAELQAYFGSGPGIASGLDGEMDDDDEIPSIVSAWSNQAKQSQSGTYNAKDVAALQQLHGKAKQASRALSGGGSVGLIKR